MSMDEVEGGEELWGRQLPLEAGIRAAGCRSSGWGT